MSSKVQKIRQEIERRTNLLQNGEADSEVMKRVEGVLLAYNSILQFIDSLPEESASEDLEEAASKYVREDFHERSRADFKAGAEWQKQKDLQDFLEKAEEFLYLQLNNGSIECGNIERLIDDFKNYMEDESEN